MDVLLHNFCVCEFITYSKINKYMLTLGLVCFRRVLPSRVNVLGYLRVRQTTTLSQQPSVEAELASHTPRKINEV